MGGKPEDMGNHTEKGVGVREESVSLARNHVKIKRPG